MIKIWCDNCRREVEIESDMGSWCSKCDAEVDDESIIWALVRAVEALQKEVEELKEGRDVSR